MTGQAKKKANKESRRPGRPLAAESQQRRAEIIDAARALFARHGYDGTSLSAVAADTGVTLAAIYHYVDGKPDLYRLVFSETVNYYWDAIRETMAAAGPDTTFSSQLSAFVDAVHQLADSERNDFLAAVGIEVRRHPEFEDLTKERDSARDPILASLLEQSLQGGSLSDGDTDHQLLMLRIVIMGWALEHVFNPNTRPQLDAALRDLAAALDRATRPAGDDIPPGRGDPRGGSPRARRSRGSRRA